MEELLGKGEKKKKKKVSGLSDFSTPVNSLPIGPLGLVSLERKPLPGIQMTGNQSKLTKSWTNPSSNIEEHKDVERVKESERDKIIGKSEKSVDLFVKEDFGLGTTEKEVSLFSSNLFYMLFFNFVWIR